MEKENNLSHDIRNHSHKFVYNRELRSKVSHQISSALILARRQRNLSPEQLSSLMRAPYNQVYAWSDPALVERILGPLFQIIEYLGLDMDVKMTDPNIQEYPSA